MKKCFVGFALLACLVAGYAIAGLDKEKVPKLLHPWESSQAPSAEVPITERPELLLAEEANNAPCAAAPAEDLSHNDGSYEVLSKQTYQVTGPFSLSQVENPAQLSLSDTSYTHFNGEDWYDTVGTNGPSSVYTNGWSLGNCLGATGSAAYSVKNPVSWREQQVRMLWFGKDGCPFPGSYGGILYIWDCIDSQWDEVLDIPASEPDPGFYWTHSWITDVARYFPDTICYVMFSALGPDRYELRDGYFEVVYVGIEEKPSRDADTYLYTLGQNTPNPFSHSTTIHYSIGEPCLVSLRVYDSAGRQVVELVRCYQRAGSYVALWNGKDRLGVDVAQGVYFYEFRAGGSSRTKSMVVAR